jgi:hypothetical protein
MFAIDPFQISHNFGSVKPSVVGFFSQKSVKKRKNGNCELWQVIMYLIEFAFNAV